MSETSKKSKNNDEFDAPEDEAFDEVEIKEDKTKTKKTRGLMARANSMANRKSSVDPILAISAVVFFLACLIVIGNTVYDNTLADHTEPYVEYGDNVKVDYIGCYNEFYDGEKADNGAVIFDTSESDLNPNVPKSYEYNPSFKPLTFKAGKSDSLLQKFQNAVIGHRPGETVTVKIDAKDGYGELTAEQMLEFVSSDAVSTTYTFANKTAFKTAFGFEAPNNGDGIVFVEPKKSVDAEGKSSPYGFGAMVITNADNTVTVTYSAVEGETYVLNKYLSITVTGVTDEMIAFDYVLQEDKIKEDKVTLIQAFVDNQAVYIKVDEDAQPLYYKTTDEKTGEDLYFTITILEFVKTA